MFACEISIIILAMFVFKFIAQYVVFSFQTSNLRFQYFGIYNFMISILVLDSSFKFLSGIPNFKVEISFSSSRISIITSDSFAIIWNKLFNNGPGKICGRQPLKNFTWSIPEYFVPFVRL